MYIPADLWFRAFLVTVLVEAPIVVLLLRRSEPAWPRALALVLFANLASHPAVWFILSQPLLIGTTEYTLVVESWAVACEAAFYWIVIRGLSVPRAIFVSLAANAASFLAGRLLVTLWPDLFW